MKRTLHVGMGRVLLTMATLANAFAEAQTIAKGSGSLPSSSLNPA
jgi:hypothetical protein